MASSTALKPTDDATRLSRMVQWLADTEFLLREHETIVKRARAGQITNLSREGLQHWLQDLKRLKKIRQIQTDMC